MWYLMTSLMSQDCGVDKLVKSTDFDSVACRFEPYHRNYVEHERINIMKMSEYNNHLHELKLPNEVWKEIKEYPNYQVSNLGRIKSTTSKVPIIRKIELNRGGYQHVKLRKNNQNKLLRVHRLVAQMFIPNPKHYDCIDHIDEDKQNNNVANLRWCSSQQNIQFMNNNHPNLQQYKRKTVTAINNDVIIFFPSIVKTANFITTHISHHTTGAALSTIYKATNVNNTAYGFHWKI